MVLRELSAADLGDGVLLDLIRNDDPIGVLSIYVDGTAIATDRGAVIDLDNQLVELERNVTADGSPLLAEALGSTLRRIAPVVERLLDTGTSGRGRLLFGKSRLPGGMDRRRAANESSPRSTCSQSGWARRGALYAAIHDARGTLRAAILRNGGRLNDPE